MRTVGRSVLACLPVFLVLPAGCEPLGAHSVTQIEIQDLSTMSPLVGVQVTATVAIRPGGEEEVEPVAPTDARGRTYVPFARVRGLPFDGVLTIAISTDERSETLRIGNQIDTLVVGRFFSVKVVGTSADLPPPVITALAGSNPATVTAVGYISSIGVCSNAMDTVTWEIVQPGNANDVFKDLAVEVGTIPDGYVDNIERFGPQSCPVYTRDRNPDGFTPYLETFDGFVVEGDEYCVSAEGSVIECP